MPPLNLGGAAHSGSGIGPNIAKRTGLKGEDRVGGGGLAQQLAPPLSGQNRVYLQQGAKLSDGSVTNDSNFKQCIRGRYNRCMDF